MPHRQKRAESRGVTIQSAILIVVALILLAYCSSDPQVVVDAGPPAPPMEHGPPNEAAGQMCVVCHTCGNDATVEEQAPIIDRQHDVCNSCHAPDGSLIVHGEDSCEWDMDCNAIPPVINCDDCHTVEYVNNLCEECH